MSKVHYIQPYSIQSPPNIGGSINQAIEQLHADAEDWICLTDMDTMWLRPDSKRQLEEILQTTDYDLLGPLCNRLANDYQVVSFMFDEYDIRQHVECANIFHRSSYGNVEPYPHVLAAFCLCFRVKTWLELGKFTENTITFDTDFSLAAHEAGMKLGLMTGIYLFHAYRLTSDNPKYDIAHLI